MITWRRLISAEMGRHQDTSDLIATAPEGIEWQDVEFCNGYGGTEGCAFTVWTADRVYFPLQYDGSERCGSVSRHPDDAPTKHQPSVWD